MKPISIEYVETSIPSGMPVAIENHIRYSLGWIKAMVDREQGDPRQIQATLWSLIATIEVYILAAETARRVR